MLISIISLVGCSNNNVTNNSDYTNDINTENGNILENPTPIHEERLSYEEYVNKFENEFQSNLLSSYSTPLQNSSDERINNIEIVCDKLNNYILKPKETFSYNNVVGPYGPSDGFEEAPILLSDGTKKDGYGGGVCQLSSTLYNVVKKKKAIIVLNLEDYFARNKSLLIL